MMQAVPRRCNICRRAAAAHKQKPGITRTKRLLRDRKYTADHPEMKKKANEKWSSNRENLTQKHDAQRVRRARRRSQQWPLFSMW
jgi:hypothetical protein